MFTEVEIANRWHCWAHNNLCPTLHKRAWLVLFVCDKACEQLTQEWIENNNQQRTIRGRRFVHFISKCGTIHFYNLILLKEICEGIYGIPLSLATSNLYYGLSFLSILKICFFQTFSLIKTKWIWIRMACIILHYRLSQISMVGHYSIQCIVIFINTTTTKYVEQ